MEHLDLLAWVVGSASALWLVCQGWRVKKVFGKMSTLGVHHQQLHLVDVVAIAKDFPIRTPAVALLICIIFLVVTAIN